VRTDELDGFLLDRGFQVFLDAYPEAGTLLEVLTPIAKSWPSEWCLEANSLAIQVHGGYGYARDYEVEQLIWMWDYTSAEDKKIIELNQAGVDSAWFEPGPYAPMEADADRYIRWYLNTLRVAAVGKSARAPGS
jgi:hypothetical protein